MTVVHFLHQTDIGLALRKHKAIYSVSPTLFSPPPSPPPFSPSLYRSLSPPLMYLHLCYANRSVVSSASLAQASLVPSLSQASIHLRILSPPARHGFPSPPPRCSFPPLSHLHPSLSPPPTHPPSSPLSLSLLLSLSLSVFSFAQLFCCRFDRYD